MNAPPRLLLITLSNIGDAVMTTPVLQAMHQLHPQALIDIVADRRSAALFEPCPFRGEIIIKDKKAGWRGLLSLVRRLRQRRYRLIVDLRTDGLSWLLRADQRRTKRDAQCSGPHAVERAYAVISPLLPPTPPQTCLWLTEQHHRQALERLLALPAGRDVFSLQPLGVAELAIVALAVAAWAALLMLTWRHRIVDRFLGI